MYSRFDVDAADVIGWTSDAALAVGSCTVTYGCAEKKTT